MPTPARPTPTDHQYPADARPRSDADELRWVEQVRAGDEGAFAAMFHAYYDTLYEFAYGYVTSAAVAEEIVQDVFLHIWQHRAAWSIGGTLRTYLFVAVRNQALNRVRHERIVRQTAERSVHTRTVPAMGEPPCAADERLEAEELDATIRCVLNGLPERCRQTFVLSRVQGLSYAEIANVMGVSAKTVQVQMGRALKALRKQLG